MRGTGSDNILYSRHLQAPPAALPDMERPAGLQQHYQNNKIGTVTSSMAGKYPQQHRLLPYRYAECSGETHSCKTNSWQLIVSSGQFAVGSLQLVDVFGRVVYGGVATGDQTVINTSKLAAGNYILLLTGKDGVKKSYKLVKE